MKTIKKSFKKLLALSMSAVLCTSSIAITASAAYDSEYGIDWIIPKNPEYHVTNYIKENRIFVRDQNWKYNMIDNNGNILFDFAFDEVIYYSDGRIAGSKDGKWGIFDINGNEILSFEYASIDYSTDNAIIACNNDGFWGIIDINGNIIAPFVYTELCHEGANRVIAANEEGSYGMLNFKGNILMPFEYIYLEYCTDDIIIASSGDDEKYGVVDIDGNVRVPFKYDRISYEGSDKILFAYEGEEASGYEKIGIIDTNGNELVAPTYGYVYGPGYQSWINENRFIVFKGQEDDGEWGVIDANGNTIVPFEYGEITVISKDLIILCKGSKQTNYYGVTYFAKESAAIVDANGNIVVPFGTYCDLWPSSEVCPNGLNMVFAKVKAPGKDEYGNDIYLTGAIDTAGNVVVPFEYTSASFSSFPIITHGGLFGTENDQRTSHQMYIGTLGSLYPQKPVETDSFRYLGKRKGVAIIDGGLARVHAPVPQTVSITLPTFKVTLNGNVMDNANAQYPLIVYNDITYFPMTYNDSRLLGVDATFTNETGLSVTSGIEAQTAYQPYIAATPNASSYIANISTDMRITVNGYYINNNYEQYPLLSFRDITYFPLTWRFAVEEFGWNYSFDATNGLVISST